jgi:hypothetical protein
MKMSGFAQRVTILAAIIVGLLTAIHARADTGPAISLTVDGGSNLPLNGTTTKLTVSFAGGPIPSQVLLSRDGAAPFATWPPSGFFTLAPDKGSLTAAWCISIGCWGGASGAHVLSLAATYNGGLVFVVSIPLNVADGQKPTPQVTAGAGPAHPADASWTGYGWVPIFRVFP